MTKQTDGATTTEVRHILGLSGGKDSTALAIYLRTRLPRIEYIFTDTGKELPETYQYLDRLEAYLGKRIVRLNGARTFDELLAARNGFLPSPKMRWCTQYLKIRPFEQYVGDDPAVSYIAIRVDERHRTGYISTKPNIKARYPFVEDGLTKQDILRILSDSGLGLPEYYRWRSRSGCFFCFFQQKAEWVGLLREHPDLFAEAMRYERVDQATGERYTWQSGESLEELARPERVQQILEEKERRNARARMRPNLPLLEVFSPDSDDEERACLICHL